MPRISDKKRSKISEQILAYLYNVSPEAPFTSKISEEIIRDEEFTKALLQDLEKSKLLVRVTKGPTGQDYARRTRWRMSSTAFEAYRRLN